MYMVPLEKVVRLDVGIRLFHSFMLGLRDASLVFGSSF